MKNKFIWEDLFYAIPKYDLKMKLTTLLLVVSLFKIQANTYSKNAKITLDLESVKIMTVIQNLVVTGTVTNNGFPLPGASILVKGTTTGSQSDFNGKYTINAPKGATLVFSYIGFKTQEIVVGENLTIDVTLLEDAASLDEVVVVGYGTQIRKNLSSSISRVDVAALNAINVQSFDAALQGMAAGVEVRSGSAIAGSAMKVRIRGTTSLSANSEPLYVIDGIPVESGEISTSQPGSTVGNRNLQLAHNTNVLASINPNDIESMEILKDASATAIYGSRGSNGVVLITTKKGKIGKTQVNVSRSSGLSEATHKIDYLNNNEYITLAQEAWFNSGNDIDDFWQDSGVLVDGLTKEEALNTDTNWVDQMLRTGETVNYNISLSGGSEKTRFYTSALLRDDKSIFVGNDYKQYSTRLNLDHTISDRFAIGTRMSLSHVDNKTVPIAWAGGTGTVQNMLPIWPVYKADGTYFNLTSNNPLASVKLREINLRSYQFFGSWFLTTDIVEGLTNRTEFGLNLLSNDDSHFRDGRTLVNGRSTAGAVIGSRKSWNFKNILNYRKDFNGHNVDVLAGFESQRFNGRVNTVIGEDFSNPSLRRPSDAANVVGTFTENEYAFLSYIGRVNYAYKNKYLLSASVRYDGSSRFAQDNRWGLFPAVSIGYNLSEEAYFAPLKKVFNYFKLRVSYGQSGNSEIGDYAYYGSFATDPYDGSSGISRNNIGDEKLGWETTTQLDIGLSFELLDGKIKGEFDYYDKLTSDLLMPYPASALTGVTNYTRNIGEISNKGVEFSLSTTNIETNNFRWVTTFNIANNKNEVLKLNDDLGGNADIGGLFEGSGIYVGFPVGVTELVEWGGVDPSTGDDIYFDKDGQKLLFSEIIDQYGRFGSFFRDNRRPMGNTWPKFTGGFANKISWKNWYLDCFFTFSYGAEAIVGEQKRSYGAFGRTKYNPTTNILDRWTSPGDITNVSRLTGENPSFQNTTRYLHKVDYIRMRDLTVGYAFNTEQGIFKRINLYAKLTNFLTFTNAPDFYWDPEFSGVVQNRSQNNINTINNDKSAPQAKTMSLGLKIDL